MADKPIILVTGATGAQGGGLAHFLKKRGKFSVRALTRDPDSKKAAALKEEGAEVVKGDLDDKESLMKAMEGCYGVFGVTNFWEHFEKEKEQGVNLINAVKESNIQHFILSTLPSVKKISKNALSSPHFDIKAELEEYARSLNLNVTFVHMAFYFENFIYFFKLEKGEDGNYHVGFPQGETPLGGVAAGDIGAVVASVFENRDEYLGKSIRIVADARPMAEYTRLMSEKIGVKVIYDYIPRETFAGFGFPGASDLADMFEFYRLHLTDESGAIAETKKIYPQVRNFETWLNENYKLLLQG